MQAKQANGPAKVTETIITSMRKRIDRFMIDFVVF
jgi:hypothetical protein